MHSPHHIPAMRQTWEEIGLDLAENDYTCIGQLDDREITTSLGKRLLMILSPFGASSTVFYVTPFRLTPSQSFCNFLRRRLRLILILRRRCTGFLWRHSFRSPPSTLGLVPSGPLSALTPHRVSHHGTRLLFEFSCVPSLVACSSPHSFFRQLPASRRLYPQTPKSPVVR